LLNHLDVLFGFVLLADEQIDAIAQVTVIFARTRHHQEVVRPSGQTRPVLSPHNPILVILAAPGGPHRQSICAVTRLGDHQTTETSAADHPRQDASGHFRVAVLRDGLREQAAANAQGQTQRQRVVGRFLHHGLARCQAVTEATESSRHKSPHGLRREHLAQDIRRQPPPLPDHVKVGSVAERP
jgi:hypothetical protein